MNFNLKKIDIPDGVKKIVSRAFNMCKNLVDVRIADSVDYIDKTAFSDCPKIKYDTSYPGLKYIDNWLMSVNDKKLPNYTLKENTVGILSGTFGECENITEIIIPNTVKYIGGSAFASCINLKKVNIPDSVTYIGKNAFTNTSIVYDTTIEGLNYLNNWLISVNKNNLSEYSLKDSTIGIYNEVFKSCVNITTLVIPISVKYIQEKIFPIDGNMETIYCEASQELSTWDPTWNYTNIDVIWDYQK